MEMSNNKKPFGYHLSLDLYGCNPEKVRDIKNNYLCLSTLPKIIVTDIQSPPFIVHKEGVGFAGWIPVVESGVSLYSFFPNNFVSIDVYTCKIFDRKKTKDFIVDTFEPTKIDEKYFLRGEDYVEPIELIKLKESAKN